MPETKSAIRKHFLEIRRNISSSDAKSASLKAAENLIKNVNLANIKTIALYHPVNGEIDPLPLMELINREITFCLPVVISKDKPLEFHSWKRDNPLISNGFYSTLLEPEVKNSPIIPDLIIVPMVAFDENRHRIGYGAGFYDRTIQELRAKGDGKRAMESKENPLPPSPLPLALTIGYAFELQKYSSHIPADHHDIKLDYIVTEARVY